MFIEVRRAKGKDKYYLVHSYRRSGEVKKIRVYLGLNLSKEEIKEKQKIAEGKIRSRIGTIANLRDPYKSVLASEELAELKSLEPKGRIKLMHLSENEWLKFTEAFAYDTNAIEGSTVDKTEVKGMLGQNKWPDKPRDEISETFGVSDAVKYLRHTKEHISIGLIEELHRLVFRNSRPFAGKFRKIGEEVAVVDALGNVIHRGAFSGQVVPLLKELVEWYEKNRSKYPPLVLAAVVHNQFESIHPFVDGNGRVGRLLLINILLKHKLPPVNIELRNRREYYAVLRSYEEDGNIRPTIEFLLKEYKRLKSIIEG
jgi:Fic family protein